jgi:hypothetical protein
MPTRNGRGLPSIDAVVASLGMLPMKHKQSSWIGNVALWVALIVTLVVVLILVNRFVPVAAG